MLKKISMNKHLLAAATICSLTLVAGVGQNTMAGILQPFSSVPFAPDADVKCLASALATGNPLTGPSTWILKAPPGCVIPWHWHTAHEQLIVIRGQVMAEMSDHPPTRLGSGGFAMMEGGMAHQFTCQGRDACVMFVTFDRSYDIHWGKGRPR
jgi:hypothetical protein